MYGTVSVITGFGCRAVGNARARVRYERSGSIKYSRHQAPTAPLPSLLHPITLIPRLIEVRARGGSRLFRRAPPRLGIVTFFLTVTLLLYLHDRVLETSSRNAQDVSHSLSVLSSKLIRGYEVFIHSKIKNLPNYPQFGSP